MDSSGNLYIADYGNNRKRTVDSAGIIFTVAGNGTAAFSGDDGPATSASLNRPVGVTVDSRVTDGQLFEEISFAVTVLKSEPVEVEIEGNTLRVVDASSTLNGMTIMQLEGEPILAQLNLGELDPALVPGQPVWVSLLSNVFVVRGSFDQNVELRYPLSDLPANVVLEDVDLYAFAEALDVDGKFWSPVFMDVDYEGTLEAPITALTAVKLGGLEGMAVWGYGADGQ